MNLAGQASVWRQVRLDCEAVALELSHLSGLTFENFYATRSAARIAATAVKDVDARIFDGENEFLSGWCFCFD